MKTLAERFWSKIDKRGAEECWPWTASTRHGGYGQLWSGGPRGNMCTAHRVSWELHNGNVPDGLHVLHHCDVRICVNPAHLFLGSNADNVADKVLKGRQAKFPGERHALAKLSAQQIMAIRNSTLKQTELATIYGVRQGYISKIQNGSAWPHLAL